MSAPVLPVPREDGYWLIENGQARFVPFVDRGAEVLPIALRKRPKRRPNAAAGELVRFPGTRITRDA